MAQCVHTIYMTKLRINDRLRPSLLATLATVALGVAGATASFAQNYPVTPQQRATARDLNSLPYQGLQRKIRSKL